MLPHEPILVVEDEPDAVTLLQHAFARAGISNPVHTVYDGDQALSYLRGQGAFGDRASHPLPALVLLDLKLPRCSGHEILQWMRQEPTLRAVPVVVLTSSKERNDVQRAYAGGANAYLVKPSSLGDLIEMATAFRVFWFGYNESPPAPVGAGE